MFPSFCISLLLSAFMILSAFAAPTPAPEGDLETRSVKITGTHSGQATYYDTGLGACGWWSKDTDLIAAVGMGLFDNYPGYNGANPNHNPVCGKKAKVHYEGKSVTVTVVDRCVGCETYDLDLSPSAFKHLASESKGRLSGMTWSFE